MNNFKTVFLNFIDRKTSFLQIFFFSLGFQFCFQFFLYPFHDRDKVILSLSLTHTRMHAHTVVLIILDAIKMYAIEIRIWSFETPNKPNNEPTFTCNCMHTETDESVLKISLNMKLMTVYWLYRLTFTFIEPFRKAWILYFSASSYTACQRYLYSQALFFLYSQALLFLI